jgi:hypothetical protein
MDKSGYIRVIEIDEAVYQLQLILEQPYFHVNGATYRYINNKINELTSEKINLQNDIQTI